jgi:hypothetical protein
MCRFRIRAAHHSSQLRPAGDPKAVARNAPSISVLRVDLTDHDLNAEAA